MKKLFIVILAIAAVSLTSCLKDKPNTDFSSIGTVIELPYAGIQYFSTDAITDANDTIIRKFGINIASAKPLSTATNYTIAVDNTLITSYEAVNNAVTYEPMPAGSFTINKLSGTIAAGKRLDSVTVTIYKALLDPTKSYMLPVKLASTNNGILSGNFNAHYYHFIGNDFAGAYNQIFRRWNADDSTSVALNGASFSGPITLFPVSPTEFTAKSGYAGSLVSYDVTFTKNTDGTYQDFSVKILPSDLTVVLPANSLSQIQAPVFLNPQPVPGTKYTYAQSLKFFRFQWIAHSTADRYLVDEYYK